MPSTQEYKCLQKASLGEKRLTFNIEDLSVEVDQKLKKEFPKLELAGGYDIMYSQNQTRSLIAIKPPYTVRKLKAETGQGKLFIRPMQKDLDLTPDVCESDEEEEDTVEICFHCNKLFYLAQLSNHLMDCRECPPSVTQAESPSASLMKGDDDNTNDQWEANPLDTASSRNQPLQSNDETPPLQHTGLIFRHAAPSTLHSQDSNASPIQQVLSPADVAPSIQQTPNPNDAVPSTHQASHPHDTAPPIQQAASSSDPPLSVQQASQPLDSGHDSLSPIQQTRHTQGTVSHLQPVLDPAYTALVDSESDSSNEILHPMFPSNFDKRAKEQASVDDIVRESIHYCNSKGLDNNPVEVLRYLQSQIVVGRALEVEDATISLSEGETNIIYVDRNNILETGMDEIAVITNYRLTLEVQFYGEEATDFGGPRKEFFKQILQSIKEKYFDHGFIEHLSNDYHTVGVIFALSMLQNGKPPQFLTEGQLDGIFNSVRPTPCMLSVRKGLSELGIYQIAKEIPIFLHLLRRNEASVMTIRKVQGLLKPEFSEEGSNTRMYEGAVYSAFVKYMREVASGRRGNITLGHVLQFCTGEDEEPILGYKLDPSIVFVQPINGSFLPTANTCTNSLKLPRGTPLENLPPIPQLHNLYDYAFANTFFGLV